jgi:hypothetical protein
VVLLTVRLSVQMVVESRALRSSLKRVLLEALHVGIGLQVARQADLEGDAAVGDVLRQPLHIVLAIHDARITNRRRIKQISAMADAIGVQLGDGLEDRLRAIGLAGVHRLLHEGAVSHLEGLGVIHRGVARLLAGQIEAHHRQPYSSRAMRAARASSSEAMA